MQITINIPTKQDFTDLILRIERELYRRSFKYEEILFSRLDQWFWVLMFKLTKHCGPRKLGHTPIFGNPKKWLWSTRIKGRERISKCAVCGYKLTWSAALAVSYKNYARRGREADLAQLNKQYKNANNEAERTAIKHTIHKIVHEDKRVSSMREDLIKATRDLEHEKIKDIHDYVGSKKALRNER